jgi:exodeoxyribonuclease VII small subunit
MPPAAKPDAPPVPEQPDPQALTFEQILQRLEGVVTSLEQGDAPLEQALSTFERGIALARLGSQRLDDAERRIEALLGDGDSLRTRPLENQDDE